MLHCNLCQPPHSCLFAGFTCSGLGTKAHTFLATSTATPTSRASWSPRWNEAARWRRRRTRFGEDTISTCHTDSLKYETMKNLIVQRNTDLTKLQDNKNLIGKKNTWKKSKYSWCSPNLNLQYSVMPQLRLTLLVIACLRVTFDCYKTASKGAK